MYQGKRIVAIIPARKGSKGIVNKNMALLVNEPLISYTIKAAKKSAFLDEIVVSTDGDEIASYALEQGVNVVRRPLHLVQDTSKTIDCIIHALDVLKNEGKQFDYMMILQPTSPCRRTDQIDGMIAWMIDKDYANAVSVTKISYNPILMRYKEGDLVQNVLSSTSTVRRQDMKDTYYVNGSLYLYKTDTLTSETSLNDARYGYETDKDSSVDINAPADLEACEILLLKRQNG